MSIQFAHISDLHLPPLPAVALREVLNKRLLGYLSWHRKRKHRHLPAAVAALEKTLDELRPDHICITGDVTNLGLPREFQAAARWLAGRGTPDSTTFVPGNHDAYVAAAVEAMRENLARWLPDRFPSVTRCAEAIFIGVSSAAATAPFLATGRVGRAQLQRLEAVLDEMRGDDRLRVVMIHHPPGDGVVNRRKALTDAEPLRRLLRRRPVDLVLHGHGHRAVHYELESDLGPVPVFGAGSASLSHAQAARTGHFQVFELSGAELRVKHYRYEPGGSRFAPAAEALVPPVPHLR